MSVNVPPIREVPVSASFSFPDGESIVVSQFSTAWINWFHDVFEALDDVATSSIFTATTAGIVPASGGGTTNFLRADGVWAAPPGGGGGVSDGDKGDITVSGGGTTWNIDNATITVPKLAADVTAVLSGKSNVGHTHDTSDIVTGTMATARLGSGTANSTTYLRGDQTWQPIPVSGGGAGATIFLEGEPGEDGAIGPPGLTGPAGSGATGAQGPVGPAVFLAADPGEDGEPGPRGLTGATGANGATGLPGPIGPAVFLDADPGEQGEMGFPGLQGPQGIQGPPGSGGSGTTFVILEAEQGEQGEMGFPGPTGATGAPGGGGNVGSATIDFGAVPGTNIASVAVTGQAAIVAGSQAQAFLMGNDSTASHNADEHGFLSRYVDFACRAVVAGTGFTIDMISELRLTGTFTVRWVWR